MNVVIGADHRGFELKETLKSWLTQEGHHVTDVGATTYNQDDDYPDFAIEVAKKVAENPDHRGIVVCGSGAGMAATADKVKGIRASLIHDAELAKAARNDDDINVLALGASFITEEHAKPVVDAFINTPFAGEERFVRRLKKIEQYEG